MACPNDHPIDIDELEPRSFSFNSPFGACPDCPGLGTRLEVDPELVVPDPTLSLGEGAIAPWSRGPRRRLLPPAARRARRRPRLRHGHAVGGRCRPRRRRRSSTATRPRCTSGYTQPLRPRALLLHQLRGRRPYIERRHARGRVATPAGSASRATCARCRARPARAPGSSRCRWRSLRRRARTSPRSARCRSTRPPSSSPTLELSTRERQIAERVLKEIQERLRFLLDVGLDYLSLDRPAGTLSGGEAQRIRLATQIGAGLVGVLYVLDEPSHRPAPARQPPADRDAGPAERPRQHADRRRARRGHHHARPTGSSTSARAPASTAARWSHSGTVKELLEHRDSLTGQYLSGRR